MKFEQKCLSLNIMKWNYDGKLIKFIFFIKYKYYLNQVFYFKIHYGEIIKNFKKYVNF